MSEQNYRYGIDWTTYFQAKLEIESELRGKISREISEYSAFAQERGISNYLISGLDIAADIALFGLNDRTKTSKQKEETDTNE